MSCLDTFTSTAPKSPTETSPSASNENKENSAAMLESDHSNAPLLGEVTNMTDDSNSVLPSGDLPNYKSTLPETQPI